MKIALLQCNAVTGDVVGNVERIAAAAREAAAAGVDLCVTPELALVGPEPGSYARMVDFADGCGRGLDLLAEAGIWQPSAEAAAAKVREVWDNPARWWLDERVQSARRAFCREHAFVDPKGPDAHIVSLLQRL